MRKMITTTALTALFALIAISSFAAPTTITRGDPNAPQFDLAIKMGTIDYGAANTKIIEFIIGNKGPQKSPSAVLIFKRGKQTEKLTINPIKPFKTAKFRISCPYNNHGAMKYTAVIKIKDADIKNNKISGTE